MALAYLQEDGLREEPNPLPRLPMSAARWVSRVEKPQKAVPRQHRRDSVSFLNLLLLHMEVLPLPSLPHLFSHLAGIRDR